MSKAEPVAASNLFYLGNLKRPKLDRAEGVYLWDTDGNRYLDASSGPMGLRSGVRPGTL